MTLVYLVIAESGLFGAYFDRDRADVIARAANGVVAEVPIVADYRPGPADGGLEHRQ